MNKKHFFGFVITALMIMSIGVPAYAAEKSHMPEVTVEKITREEYLQLYADEYHVSMEEARKIDAQNTIESLKKEQTKALLTKNIDKNDVALKSTEYVIYRVSWDEGHGSFKSHFEGRIHAKVQAYNVSGYGQYQIVTDILNKTVSLEGSADANKVEKEILSVEIEDGRDGYSNEIRFMFSGTLVHEYTSEISAGLSADIELAGFDITASISGTTYCRKVVDYNTRINSNSVLA